MNLFALLTSLGAPLPPNFDTYTWETVGRGDALALDLLNPQDAGEIVATLRAMGIQADDVSSAGGWREVLFAPSHEN